MKTIPVSFLVAGMLLPAICLAQVPDPTSEKKRPKGEPHRPFVEAWKKVDADRDGFISRDEFMEMPRVKNLPEEKRTSIFSRLDKDGDGKLSRDELMKFGRAHDGEPAKRLWELDADKSGGVSFEEFKQGPFVKKLDPEKVSKMFNRLDTDSDGFITPKDRPEMPSKRPDEKQRKGEDSPHHEKKHQKLDTDGDGSLSFEEFRVGPEVRDLSEDEQEDRFQKLDSNGDHKISSGERPSVSSGPKMEE